MEFLYDRIKIFFLFLLFFFYKYNRILIYDIHSMIIVFYYQIKDINSFLVLTDLLSNGKKLNKLSSSLIIKIKGGPNDCYLLLDPKYQLVFCINRSLI